MNVIDALKWRYATKKFDPEKKLSSDKIDTLKKAFNLTATSFGLQPVKLLVISDQAIKEELVAHSFNQQQVADASHLLVFAVETDLDKDYINGYFNRVKDIRQTPDEILKPFREYLEGSVTAMEDTTKREWIAKQAYLAMGNLLTVCALEQIDACPMEGFVAPEYDRILNLKEKGLTAVLSMPVGFRANDDMFAEMKKVRKELTESILEI
ncbi:NAD(P)H-dependent oxidoreductase [Robertkochia marina]|uniref:NAD(P)H-dependent oxidoreductase n=1 Tax=Robertkochia marina TaxID=1227945 RepID=A0A4S3LZS0_9FLAO|nr:NAD(P)H-dependent oxidoreductase [Robertkochia marina]THD67640.1 NAD(P)H-dependent oxidoreductase [Robertkochia marina]TRZ43373.1 NAD(P)H-dependent oxidoreductase [Robertkochia marina]